MERWQIDYINHNLRGLVRNTLCNIELKVGLLARGLLTDEDEECLSAIGRQDGRFAEAKALYTILKERKDGYSGLMEILATTKQTGALNLLQMGEPRKKSSVLSIQAEQFLSLKVKFLGIVTEVRNAFPTLTIKDIVELLRNGKMRNEFENWKTLNLALDLDTVLPEPNPLYIPRRISNRVALLPEVFKRDCSDIFVFKGLRKDELKKLVAPHLVMSSSDQLSFITCRHIYLDNEEDWDDLVQFTKAPLHMIAKQVIRRQKVDKEIFIVAKSTEASILIRESSSRMSEKSRDVYITEGEFIKQLQSKNSLCGACLCDVPGMGKSWLLQSLARRLRKEVPASPVFFTTLSSLSQYLEETEIKQADDAFFALLKYFYSTDLAAALVQRYAKRPNLHSYILLDGFDEILDSRSDRTISMLQSMFQLQSTVKMIITSRPHMRETLESAFGVIAFDMLPFDRTEQIKAITSIWRAKFPDHNFSKFEEYARHCVKITKGIKKERDPDILGVPLKCYLLAFASEKNACQFAYPNRKHDVELSELAISCSVFDLYQDFVNAGMNKVALGLGINNEAERLEWIEVMHLYHTSAAISLLYPEFSQKYLKRLTRKSNAIPAEVSRVGIIHVADSDITFVHRSIAEYFAGCFFADLWKDDYKKYDKIWKPSTKFFFNEILRTYTSTDELMFLEFGDFFTTKVPYINIYEFTEGTVLWFVERSFLSNANSPSSYPNVSKSAKVLSEIKYRKPLSSLPRREDQCFEEYLFRILFCCIRGGFMKILQLLTRITQASKHKSCLSTIFRLKSALVPFTAPVYGGLQNSELAAVCILLLQCAERGSEEIAHEVFNLFTDSTTNHFRDIFHRSSSHLKRRILSVTHTHAQYNKSWCWFFPFLTETKLLLEDELLIFEFVKAVNRISKSPLEDSLDSISLCVAYQNWKQIKQILSQSGIDLRNTSPLYKLKVVVYVISTFTDSELVVVLVDMFGKPSERSNFWAKHNINTIDLHYKPPNLVVNECLWKAEDVLEAIDLQECSHVFSSITTDNTQDWFQRLEGIEILKVLMRIRKDIRNNDYYSWDYLHWAVWKGNTNWVRYLLKNGHDVKAVDKYGKTPLHPVNPFCSIEITELLLAHGVDVYALTPVEDNVVHWYYMHQYSVEKSRLVEWTTYMLDKGHHKLWIMKNKHGETPLDLLPQRHEKAFCNKIASLVKKYEARANIFEGVKLERSLSF